MWVKSFVGGYCSNASSFTNKLLEIIPIPIAGKVAIINNNRSVVIDKIFDLQDGMNRSQLMRRNTHHTAARAILIQDFCHPIIRIIQMILITDKNKILLTWKHIDHMSNDRLSVNFDQGFRLGITCAAEALAEPRHRNNNLHKTPILLASYEALPSTSCIIHKNALRKTILIGAKGICHL